MQKTIFKRGKHKFNYIETYIISRQLWSFILGQVRTFLSGSKWHIRYFFSKISKIDEVSKNGHRRVRSLTFLRKK